jgi:hypothetical protein
MVLSNGLRILDKGRRHDILPPVRKPTNVIMSAAFSAVLFLPLLGTVGLPGGLRSPAYGA